MGAPAQHELHMDSCCSPEMGQATAQTVATARVDETCWGWKECVGGGSRSVRGTFNMNVWSHDISLFG